MTCRRAPAALVLAALLAGLAACGTGAGEGPRPDPDRHPCDDRVRASSDVPAPTRARLDAAGIDAVVGEGDVWLVAPQLDRWGELFEADPSTSGGGRRAKVAVWVDAGEEPPEVRVEADGPTGDGPAASAESAPTAEGLPGALPTTLRVPGPGCYRVVVQGREGVATVRARVT